MKNDILRFLKKDANADARFTTMVDLYALANDFPGLDAAKRACGDPYQRVEFLEDAFARDIADRRFLPYIQLHEFEAILLTDPEVFRSQSPDANAHVANIERAVETAGGPERVNDGPLTAPSKRIESEFPAYDKVADGFLLAQRIGLAAIREKCPHFAQWLTCLEQLPS